MKIQVRVGRVDHGPAVRPGLCHGLLQQGHGGGAGGRGDGPPGVAGGAWGQGPVVGQAKVIGHVGGWCRVGVLSVTDVGIS